MRDFGYTEAAQRGAQMSHFSAHVTSSNNPLIECLLFIAGWLSQADGTLDEREVALMETIALESNAPSVLQSIISLSRRPSLEDLSLACRILLRAPIGDRSQLLRLIIEIALADTRLTTAEGHIIRFLADLFDFTPQEVDSVFRDVTGDPMPSARDPSRRERPSSRRSASSEQATADPAYSPSQRELDLKALGLSVQASPSEIRDAFRRLAQLYHPDKVYGLGPEASDAASLVFRRMKQAYDRLVSR